MGNQCVSGKRKARNYGPSERFVAIYDFKARNNNDLSFRRGDLLDVANPTASSDAWWEATSVSKGKVGTVPANFLFSYVSLDKAEWFFGRATRTDAEHYLQTKRNSTGSFLVRESESGHGTYALSMHNGRTVTHYKILRDERGSYYIGERTFRTLQELVGFYSQQKGGLSCQLAQPCVETDPEPQISSSSGGCSVKGGLEIKREDIQFVRKLGQGQFGEVYEGLWQNTVPIAVKKLMPGAMNPKEFLAEADLMIQLQHVRLLRPLGVCTLQEPVLIVTQLMRNGSLLNFLKSPKGRELSVRAMIDLASQIANGMVYLELKKCIHRDLAARNVLIGEYNSVKIADFGLARFLKSKDGSSSSDNEIYTSVSGIKIPVRWTAPEAAIENKFSMKSDVWSFGIVLVEIVTLGKLPYHDINNNEDVLLKVRAGYRIPQPDGCPDQLYRLMLECWKTEPVNRPTFEALQNSLDDCYRERNDYRETPT